MPRAGTAVVNGATIEASATLPWSASALPKPASDSVAGEAAIPWILLACATYHLILCIVHTWILRASPALVGAAELTIYAACVPILARRFVPHALFVLAIVVINFCVIALVRGDFDFKGVRDLAIPVLFIWLGYAIGNEQVVDKALKRIVVVVLAVGLFEWLFLDVFTRWLDVFSYYVNIGGIDEKAAMYAGQRLQLNGFRPEGIGRTILPDLFGNHRVSSVFLEAVSLGNFAVIIAAWGLSKDRRELGLTAFYLCSALVLVALSDSRFGMVMIAAMLVVRCVHLAGAKAAAAVLPLAAIAGVLVVGAYFPTGGDNFLGRLFLSGATLLDFDERSLLGIKALVFYGDAGYPYVFARFGLLLCVFLWLVFLLIPSETATGERFKIFVAIYVSLILTVSGSSFFALKTAGILWFLFGVASSRTHRESVASDERGVNKPTRAEFAPGSPCRSR